MLERFIYENHLGKRLICGQGGLYANSNSLRDFAWNIKEKNNKIASFERGITKAQIPLIIKARTDQEGIDLKNRFFELTEIDVIDKECGKIIIGDYYLPCYVTESKKSNYLIAKDLLYLTITVTTDVSMWIREEKFAFSAAVSAGNTSYGLDYPFDYAYDYMNRMVNSNLVNSAFTSSEFELIIYGACENPQILIGPNLYGVDATLATGEYLIINSVTKKIYKVKNNGEKVNLFHFRNRSSDVFEKIPSGINQVSWHGFGFDITLLEERSEPKWT